MTRTILIWANVAINSKYAYGELVVPGLKIAAVTGLKRRWAETGLARRLNTLVMNIDISMVNTLGKHTDH